MCEKDNSGHAEDSLTILTIIYSVREANCGVIAGICRLLGYRMVVVNHLAVGTLDPISFLSSSATRSGSLGEYRPVPFGIHESVVMGVTSSMDIRLFFQAKPDSSCYIYVSRDWPDWLILAINLPFLGKDPLP